MAKVCPQQGGAEVESATWLKRLAWQARRLKRETLALYLASRDRRTPWYAKVWLALVVAYALSPIDLVPDFVPVLGYLDDVILVPLGIWLGLRMVPPEVMADARAAAEACRAAPTRLRIWGTVIVVCLWLLALVVCGLAVYRLLQAVWAQPIGAAPCEPAFRLGLSRYVSSA
ncbi:MAG: DUF1232 domain-containing protein [Chloroflexi bacterium]|nr:DUF1232 domain-containing protein [Chloroflexota bacterium]